MFRKLPPTSYGRHYISLIYLNLLWHWTYVLPPVEIYPDQQLFG